MGADVLVLWSRRPTTEEDNNEKSRHPENRRNDGKKTDTIFHFAYLLPMSSLFSRFWIFLTFLGQDFYQTYACITGNQGLVQIFWGPFSLNTGNKQKTSREGLFFFCAKVGLHETLVIIPSEFVDLWDVLFCSWPMGSQCKSRNVTWASTKSPIC